MLFELLLLVIAFYVFIYMYEGAKKAKLETLQQDYRYRLFALRDHLRESAIDGKLDKDSWVFDYLDTSITKTINLLPRLTVWVFALVFNRNRDKPDFKKVKEILIEELRKPENRNMKLIHKGFIVTLDSYLKERHKFFCIEVLNLFGI